MIPNIEAARKFVAALKSDDYDQVRGSLISYPGNMYHPEGKGVCYCAQGVFVMTALSGEFDRHSAVFELNGEPQRESGLLQDETIVHVFGEPVPLVAWNDSYRMTFSRIADLLEEKYPELKG